MKIKSKVFVSTLLLVAAGGSQAQTQPESKLYGEVGYAATSFKENDVVDRYKAKPAIVTGIVGYKFEPHFAVEAFLGLGAKSGELKLNGAPTGFNVKINNTMGVFVRPSLKVSDDVELFARLGYVHSKVTLSGLGVSESDTDNSVAYGLGGNVYLSKSSYLQLNWTNYYKKDGVKIDGIGVAYGFKF
ncbi:MAG: hypothetical protein DCF26_17690 [Burkholderiales bacterium]|nr:MAG: hypothetical protein DCF26_17690 [Burkholderiales bacterium]